MTAERYRVGHRVPLHLYLGDEPIGTALTADLAHELIHDARIGRAATDEDPHLIDCLAQDAQDLGLTEREVRAVLRAIERLVIEAGI